ncbi:MAG: NAD+ synthase, partial [Betaproteobacteria bacterium]|nr:NAD+ synthase [Betaproteobacteria bacterium]
MKIAIAQINFTVGDLAGNSDKIAAAAARARGGGASLLLTTELGLCGYPPEDLLLREDFYRSCAQTLGALVRRLDGITVVVGHPHEVGGKHYNAASVIREGEIVATYLKHNLPNYTVFDEERYFDAGTEPCVFEHEGLRFGINICADVWEEGAADLAREAGAQALLVLNASPYHMNKQLSRYEVIRDRVSDTGLPVIYTNQVGGQDELVFDGASFAVDGRGNLTHQLVAFDEMLAFVDLVEGVPVKGEIAPTLALEAEVYKALTVGVRDYIEKNGFPGALIGLSGGIDSALTL